MVGTTEVDKDMQEGFKGLIKLGLIEPIDFTVDDPTIKPTAAGRMLLTLCIERMIAWNKDGVF